ncbi:MULTISPECIES: NusG domain II-containing protein [Desulfitobacterium]|uniref:Uncharacterized protein n=1 Tax=Desulfitobacterium dehalogenans (strain ATCC 51507 / DSM 9161 / JW/IU-DC1) TaxID=756499 RepID=I4A7R9_DESDJ|nr:MULTISPECIES: NusG domain II-containing protein [Desulfitobacterium]AFM00004.1 hypothetical protein Desde_1601 [Desulfitobacterium dehalogenans ATCC 51507]
MKKFEKLFMIGILIVSSILVGTMTLAKSDKANANIVIVIENEVKERIPLVVKEETQTHEFKFRDQTGYLEVKNGKVRMLEMPKEICPEGICSKTGWIDSSTQAIVCLPNKIIVTIQGLENDTRE